MAKQFTFLTIFISCPGDMDEDKSSAARAVSEANKILRSSGSPIQFDIWEWKEDALPGVGIDPQNVIDQQIPEHDVYLGLMWKKFGQPTSIYGSGTEHEFRTSLEKHRSLQTPKHILFLFKTSIDSLTQLDANEWAQITNFRNGLGDLGVLHQSYEKTDNLERLLRLHLSKIARSWSENSSASGPVGSLAVSDKPANPTSEEEGGNDDTPLDVDSGYFDYLDRFHSSIERAGELITSMHLPLNQMTTSIQSGTAQLEEAISLYGKGKVPTSIPYKISNSIGDEILTFAGLGIPLTEEADAHFNNAFDCLESAIEITKNDSNINNKSDILDLSSQLDSFMIIITNSNDNVKEMGLKITQSSHYSSKMKKGSKALSQFVTKYSRMCLSMRLRVDNLKAFLNKEFNLEPN